MVRTISLLVACVAASAPAFADNVLTEIQACRGLGDAARLACFDRVLARHEAAPAAPAAAVSPAVAAPVDRSFGAERLPNAERPQQPETMTAKVVSISYNAFKKFTITLDNGQVWRQNESDSPVAHFDATDTVRITRGFLDSYNLKVDGGWGIFKVKRIK
jgi:hypothetical protein